MLIPYKMNMQLPYYSKLLDFHNIDYDILKQIFDLM